MRRILWSLTALAVASLGLLETGVSAEARTKTRPLIIKKRNFLDAGVNVPLGYGQGYALDSSFAGRPAFGGSFSQDRFGGGNLPTRFSAPGRAQPVAVFFTPAF